MLRLAALLFLVPIATAQTPTAVADLAAIPVAGLTDNLYCLAQPGQTPGVVRVVLERPVSRAEAFALVDVGPGATVRAPHPQVERVSFLNVEVPRGAETSWCERLSALPGVRVAMRPDPAVWRKGLSRTWQTTTHCLAGEISHQPVETVWRYQRAVAGFIER